MKPNLHWVLATELANYNFDYIQAAEEEGREGMKDENNNGL